MYSESHEFIERYEKKAKELLKNGPVKIKNDLDSWLEEQKDQEINLKYNQIKEGVFQCTICEKKFQTKEFVRKHIINKHEDKSSSVELQASVWKKQKAADGFNNDKNRITLIPKKAALMQQKKDF